MTDDTPGDDPISTEIAEIHSDHKAYWYGPQAAELQARGLELAEAQTSGVTPPPAAAQSRMAQIEQAMRDTSGPYYSGPKNASGETLMAAEYRQLLEDESGDQDGDQPSDGRYDTPAVIENISALGADGEQWIVQLEDACHTRQVLEATADAVDAIFSDFDDPDGVDAAFSGLDGVIQVAVLRELANPVPQQIDVPAKDVQQFSETDHGQILLAHWPEAEHGQRIAKVLERWNRITEGLDDDQFREADDFVRNRLSALERAQIMNRASC